ncbi:hypothetical protein Syun_027448 [Stephania yunnanensis]|uniref:Pentatricopeptide repeat-containing protein n=1 Tax=Stephania yunnanensis TaxID=152371 RepID=A0AAP0EKQ1_9MAGN
MSQWMTDRKYDALSPGDMAIRLDLISKIHGLEEAEKYFDSIPEQSRGIQTYGALLNCYAHNKSVDKADALMQKMKELGLTMKALPYNVLLNLFYQVGQYEKLDTLMEEMKEKGIEMDKFTFSIRLSACVATSDVEGLERILKRIEDDSQVTVDWKCCAIAADGYIKAGLIDKALKMLKRSEELVLGKNKLGKNKRSAYENLLTLYANAGQKDEVYRIWKCYKSSEKKLYNTAYICMISSLSKLGDIPGAEKIIKEWESVKTNYDFKVPNCLIAAYCNNGLLEKAETFMSKEIEKGNKPIPSAWNRLAAAYVKENQIPKAVDAVRKSFQASRRWKPNLEVLLDDPNDPVGCAFSNERREMAKHLCTNSHGYSSPVPIVGLYIASASLVCLLLKLWDISFAIWCRNHHIPCRRFSLNSVTLTLLAIVAKLPVDLTTDMPRARDQLSKLAGTTMTCICIGFMAPLLVVERLKALRIWPR